MEAENITLMPLTEEYREKFIKDNQWAFKYGAMEEFGKRDDHFEEEGEIISRKTIKRCLDAPNSEAYRIMQNGEPVGGLVLKINAETHRNELELLFATPSEHSRGVGFAAWKLVEKLHPETEVWETFTPYFETRNIHFYINKCGFHAVEFFNPKHPAPANPEFEDEEPAPDDGGFDGMFRFEKVMKH